MITVVNSLAILRQSLGNPVAVNQKTNEKARKDRLVGLELFLLMKVVK